MTALRKELERCLASHGDGPLLVHSDLFRAAVFADKSTDRGQLLRNHRSTVESLVDHDQLWIPAFNYQFPTSRVFDVVNTRAELGPFDEFMRTSWATQRSLDPIFSFSSRTSIRMREKIADELVAFSHQTAFSTLVDEGGGILFYGAALSSATVIHHVEFLSGGPLYRYDKRFDGHVIDRDGGRIPISYVYHVRPMGMHLDYDWPRIERDLKAEGMVRTVTRNNVDLAIYCRAADLSASWLARLERDPLYLLDQTSRSWVEPRLDDLGRRFVISDFETEPS
jgi:aminoglycoside 3-N-acetyltransferase